MLQQKIAVWLMAMVVAMTGLPAFAQDLKKGITELSQVDHDYHIQGEYIGSIPVAGCCRWGCRLSPKVRANLMP